MSKKIYLKAFVFFLAIMNSMHISAQKNQPDKSGNAIDLVFIGNSITYGVLLDNRDIEAPPTIAADYLSQFSCVSSVRFLNNGKSGYTTVDFLPSKGTTFKKLVNAAHQFHQDTSRILIFSIMLGTNDSAEDGPTGSPVSPDDYQKNLKSIADALLADFENCRIIFQQPLWYSPNTWNKSRYMKDGLIRLKTYFPKLKELVANYAENNQHNVFLCNLKSFRVFKNNYKKFLTPEKGHAGAFYLHPNKKGAIILGRLWGESIYYNMLKMHLK